MRYLGFLLPCVLAACSTQGSNQAPLVPNDVITVVAGPGGTITAGAAVAIGTAYLIYDPLAPNWEMQERRLEERRFYLSLLMKRFNTGGDGDALSIVKRRAQDLVTANGMGYYKIESLEQKIDSQTIGARRTAEAVIVLYPHAQPVHPVSYPPILITPVSVSHTVTSNKAGANAKSKKTAVVKPVTASTGKAN